MVVMVFIISLGLLAQKYTSLEWLIHRESKLRAIVDQRPVESWMAGFLIYICLSLIPGTSGKSVIVGWLFGFWSAVMLVDSALTIAAMTTFFLSRVLFREAVEHRFGIYLHYLRQKLHHNAQFYLLTLRLAHAPFSIVNYGVGATNIVSAFTFWWSTQVGLLPGTIVFVFVGTRIPALSTIAEKGVLTLLDLSLILSLIATAFLPLAARCLVRTFQRRFANRHADCDSPICQTKDGELHVRE